MPYFPALFDLSTLDGSNGFAGVGAGDYQAERNGTDVAGIGDLNGDGFDDVLSSAPFVGVWYDGAVELTLGSDAPRSAIGPLGDRRFLPAGGEYEYLSTVQAAGDVNGDGFADFVATGGGGTLDPTPRNYVVFGSGDLGEIAFRMGNLDGSNGFKVSDGSVSAAGDVNGDGFGDLFLDDRIVFGKASGFAAYEDGSGLDGSNGFALAGSFTSRARGGDVNGDGFDDLIVGDSQADTNGTNSGETYVLFGKATGFTATIDASSVDGTTGFRIAGAAAGNLGGAAVATAGDVNGDGFDDLSIWSPAVGSYVVFGRASDFADGIDLATLDSSQGFRITGADGIARAAGDIDGDTLGDLVIGSRTIVFGMAGSTVADVDATALDGSRGFVFTGSGSTRTNLDGAGDVNGDGFGDIVIGAPTAYGSYDYNRYPDLVGKVYVVFGHDRGPVMWTGTSADEAIVGSARNDVLDGRGGKDRLRGIGGDDLLLGGAGSDTLDGGAGNDTVAFTGASHGVTLDLAAGRSIGTGLGNDTLIAIENAIGTNYADRLDGDAGANRLDGGGGDDTLRGGLGDDTYVVDSPGDTIVEARDQGTDTVETTLASHALASSLENLVYLGSGSFHGTGNTLANLLVGGGGDDDLKGGRGADTLRGGFGNDIYRVDDVGDLVDETDGAGIDTIESTITWTLAGELENLVLRGTAPISGTGNELANLLVGNKADNTLLGLGGDDVLIGGDGDDRLLGGDGDDTLHGFLGNDVLRGGLGDDTYIAAAGDRVSEADGGGIDSVHTYGSFTLGSGFENLSTSLSWGAWLTGNGLANRIAGSNWEDRLIGLRGDDTLFGKGRADTFVFGTGFGRDRIADFTAEDRIQFEDGLFADFADVMAHARQLDGGVEIVWSNTNRITLSGVQLGSLSGDQFVFG